MVETEGKKEIMRRRTCQEHSETMKEVFQKIESRLPIWVFLASIGIIGSCFGFVALVNRDSSQSAHSRMSAMTAATERSMEKISAEISKVNETLYVLGVKQAETSRDVKGIVCDIEELKQQKKR